jgi:hypothetical protein
MAGERTLFGRGRLADVMACMGRMKAGKGGLEVDPLGGVGEGG